MKALSKMKRKNKRQKILYEVAFIDPRFRMKYFSALVILSLPDLLSDNEASPEMTHESHPAWPQIPI